MNDAASRSEGDWIDTLQGLLIAFVVAMVFRGFAMEGFFIPTGSMGPTLKGQHVRLRGDHTGYAYDADAGPLFEGGSAANASVPVLDPMVSRQMPVGAEELGLLRRQSVGGDRVLVVKYVPWVFPPQRWDVPVFKNPPDPVGDTQNYIKRLVGMPGESVVLADGDVFVAQAGAEADDLRIVRKPEMVQRVVWQPVWHSDWRPVDVPRLEQRMRRGWPGPALKPQAADRGAWTWTDTRDWSWPRESATRLELDTRAWPITDWSAYNAWRRVPEYPVSDVRMRGAFEPQDPAAFSASMELRTRGLLVTAGIRHGEAFATVAMESGTAVPLASTSVPLGDVGSVIDLDLWHVDQAVWVFVQGKAVIDLPYELDADGTSPRERLVACGVDLARAATNPMDARSQPLQSLAWNLSGTPFTARGLRIDRDLHYQPGILLPGNQVPSNGPLLNGRAFACDAANPAVLGSDQYLLLGDNSPASRDSRYWGRPHPILKSAIGFDTPFVVPGELLVGHAWCVYFPATYPLGGGLDMRDPSGRSPGIVPNFGSLRFIR